MFGLKSCAIKVELLISCSELLNKDITSKSDPLCLVELQDNISKKWHEVGRTERIVNSLNPNFSKRIKLEYLFEEVQNVRFMVYDIDNETSSLDDDDFLGKVESTLGQIVSQKKKSMLLSVKKRQHGSDSKITVVAEEINDNRVVSFNIKASNLDNKDFLGKSDPYLEIWKQNHGGETDWALSHRTEVIKNTLNPLWKPFSVPFHALCGESSEAKLKFVCYDWDSDGSHDLIGEFYTTFAEVQDGNSSREFPCINPKKKKKKKSYTNSGVVTIVSCETRRDYSFLDYIFGGLQLNFTVGVDFTGSNGDPRSPTSLHFINPTQPNHYMQTLHAVGAVIQDYDHDKLFPAFGFGAKLATGEVSHEFALNFNPTNPYCAGVEGIVDAYKLAIPQVQLWGPTCIAPIINHVARFAQQACNSNYFVLLIVTDGVITDMDETKSAIVYASRLPMSIIIVGVGEADFSAMEELDGDDGVLRSATGQPVSRDIVQFVPFRQFRTSQQIATLALSKAVLAELPTQVTGYYKSHKIVPGNYAAADASS